MGIWLLRLAAQRRKSDGLDQGKRLQLCDDYSRKHHSYCQILHLKFKFVYKFTFRSAPLAFEVVDLAFPVQKSPSLSLKRGHLISIRERKSHSITGSCLQRATSIPCMNAPSYFLTCQLAN